VDDVILLTLFFKAAQGRSIHQIDLKAILKPKIDSVSNGGLGIS
jgi:hypothetical protein